MSNIYLDAAAVIVMAIGIIGIFINRWCLERSIGVRIIQFLSVTLVVPVVFILALEGILASETVGTLLGAVVGYTLSGIGKDEPNAGE